MDDLVEFLRARYDEETTLAQAAGGDEWRRQDHPSDTVAVRDSKGEPVVYDEGWPSEAQAEHIRRHDPARVLRDIEARRRIVNLHRPQQSVQPDGITNLDCTTCGGEDRLSPSWPCPTIRYLALPFAGHPDYREEWRP